MQLMSFRSKAGLGSFQQLRPEALTLVVPKVQAAILAGLTNPKPVLHSDSSELLSEGKQARHVSTSRTTIPPATLG